MKSLCRVLPAFLFFWPGFAEAAGGAFAVDDAAVELAGVCKVETIAALGLGTNNDGFLVSTPACALAFGTHRAELAASIGRRRAFDTYATPALVKFKTPIPGLDFAAEGKFGAAFSAGYLTDFDGAGRNGYFFTAPLSFRIDETFLFNVNIGRTEYDNRVDSFTSWGASLEMNLKKIGYEQFTLVAETFSPRKDETAYQLGARYSHSATLDFDVLLGRNLGGERKNWLTLGLTQRF
jgi:hypothetical protein